MTKKSISRLLQASLMCCLAVLFTACDDIFASEDNPIPAYLSMSDKPVTIKVGDTYRRKAISVITAVVEYTSSDTKVATVDGEGVVTAIAEGTATITATATGYSSQTGKKIYQPASVSYVVTVKAAIATITTPPEAATGDIAACSETALVTAGVADGGTMMYEVTTTNTKPTTTEGFGATIPTAANLGVGTYYVWYYAKGNTGYNDSEIAASAVEVTVVPTLSTPLTLEAITAGTIKVTGPQAGMKYSKDGGITKLPVSANPTNISVAAGEKVAFYGTATSYNGTNIGGNGDGFKCKVYGNIMSLVDETGFATNTELTAENTFRALFYENTYLTDASDLLLPATTLTANCYYDMFNGCTSLTAAPELPATDLTGASYCYNSMFQGCTSLIAAPELKATMIANDCYNCMFYGCSSLTTAPAELPAMTMASQCYAGMFFNCTSLTTAPKLPATTLGYACYYCMFYGCTSLTATPKLPATALATGCYNNMFNGCTSLTNAYVKAAFTTTGGACSNMFKNCQNLSTSTLYTDGTNWSSCGDISNWQKTDYPTE